MIETTLISYFGTAFPQIPVLAERPSEDIPEKYIVIDNTGTSETHFVKSSVVAVQSYGASLYEAAALNDQILEAARDLITLPEICSCRLNSAYNFSDTASKIYRYQAVFSITHY